MGFWGLEVKPGKPQPYSPQNEQGKLHLTQATLGAGLGNGKSVIQCSVGDKKPIYLCSLLPNKNECCPLNLEFDDGDEPVEFSVTGDRSIHLTGYLEAFDEEYDEDDDEEDDPYGIEIGESESGESSDYDSEEGDRMDEIEDFLDSNLEMYRRSSAPKSRVVIEEIEDEEKPAKENKTKRPKKKSQASEIVESEDEDGLPISKEAREPENEHVSNKKRKANASVQDVVQESASEKKKKKNQREQKKGENVSNEEAQNGTLNSSMTASSKTPDRSAEKKTKKKKKNNSSEEATVESKAISSSVEKQKADPISEGKQVNTKPSHVRTYPNGLIVEELGMGKPNAKKAVPGSQVSVRYIGKLQKNGKIFDSNIGKAPFKFRLGVGKVIKGWDVGVNGMRVGDKRKLTIPPAMGYGAKGVGGGLIPPNAWLTFDVELIDVKPK